jgi:enoyl-CoA hydratase
VNDEVLTERRGRVLVITLNRPQARNAIDESMARGLVRAIEELEGDPQLGVGLLTGAGGSFCAGMDLKAFARGERLEAFTTFIRYGTTKPLLAAVEGHAVAGGLEIALTCDVIVAARDARFGLPEVGVGLFAAAGGLARLPRFLPYGLAALISMSARPIPAEEAHAHGLVTRLTEPGAALDEALVLAEQIGANAPLGLAATRRLLRTAYGQTEEEFWPLETELRAKVFASADAREGALAFAEKRLPTWTGTTL